MRAAVRIIAGRSRPVLDGFVKPTCAYSFRRLLTSYKTNKAFNVVRASDSLTRDIGFTSDGMPDVAGLTSFLSGTTGKVVTWYDQSGSFDLTQATDANRPTIVLSALNSFFPCMQSTAATMLLASAGNLTPATGLMSFSLVYNRVAGTGTTGPRLNGANNVFRGQSGVADAWQLVGGTSGTITFGSADNAWHSTCCVLDGANSAITNYLTPTSGTATGNTTAAPIDIRGAASTTFNFWEMIVWDNVTITGVERRALNVNQRALLKY